MHLHCMLIIHFVNSEYVQESCGCLGLISVFRTCYMFKKHKPLLLSLAATTMKENLGQ